ncbi:hypothetical protein HZH66_012763 [Vespula vulgaris]|uniref:Uncharacterized protein n=1 Tax=Vespula vulgaris TaxID=7454 RepID=A0A834J7N0_VESVU|nr:hypothetical protein HZH66_012763 [Vespula vulgaris]
MVGHRLKAIVGIRVHVQIPKGRESVDTHFLVHLLCVMHAKHAREVEAGWSKELKRARSTEAEARLSRRRRPFRRKDETEQDGNGSVDWWK